MSTLTQPLIVCENLVKIFKVADLEVVALQGLDLVVERGEMLGIVGNSGSGKTTLMNILGGLDRPSAGKVMVDGLDLLNLSDHEMNIYQRKKVGFVWQQTSRNLVSYLSAQENVELPMTMAWIRSPAEKREWSSELLSAVGLYNRRKHKLTELSGGEQQRVAIAVALANKPALLLGDEPTGEVDTATAQGIMDTFRQLGKLMDLTIIIVTHDPRISRQVDRVVAIRDGKISSEIVRQVNSTPFQPMGYPSSAVSEDTTIHPAKDAITYHEYVVLDNAGRLQIPRDWLEQLGIGKRAQLRLEAGMIHIEPVQSENDKTKPRQLTFEEQIELLFSQPPPAPPKRWYTRVRSIFQR